MPPPEEIQIICEFRKSANDFNFKVISKNESASCRVSIRIGIFVILVSFFLPHGRIVQ